MQVNNIMWSLKKPYLISKCLHNFFQLQGINKNGSNKGFYI